jgi:hypothetical protein
MILKHFEGGLHCQMGPLPLRYENVRRKNSQLTSYEGPAVVKEARRSLTMSLSVRTALCTIGVREVTVNSRDGERFVKRLEEVQSEIARLIPVAALGKPCHIYALLVCPQEIESSSLWPKATALARIQRKED